MPVTELFLLAMVLIFALPYLVWRLFLLLLALIVELGLLGGHDAPREAGLWLWCVGVYLVGAANYTRTSPSEPVRTGETPNA